MSCLNARWITPSDAAAASAQDVEIVEGAAPHLARRRRSSASAEASERASPTT